MQNRPESHEKSSQRLVFHIRRLRQWFEDRPLSQGELAERSGVPARTLRTLEQRRSLPKAIEMMLRISIALNVPLDKLIDPASRREVEEQLGLVPRPGRAVYTGASSRSSHQYSPTLAVCHRVPYLVLAICDGMEVLEVIRRRAAAPDTFGEMIRRVITEYGCQTVLLEPNSQLVNEVENLQCRIHTLSLKQAKHLLFPEESNVTNRQLFHHLVECEPRFRRMVQILPGTGRIAMTQRWRTVVLTAVALARAYIRLERERDIPIKKPFS